jgi:hypothetical protein
MLSSYVCVFHCRTFTSSDRPIARKEQSNADKSRLGGVVVSVLTTGHKGRGFEPGKGGGGR